MSRADEELNPCGSRRTAGTPDLQILRIFQGSLVDGERFTGFLVRRQLQTVRDAGVHIDAVNLAVPFPVPKAPAPEQFERAVGSPRGGQQHDLAHEGVVAFGHGVVVLREHLQALGHGCAGGFVLRVEFVEEPRLGRVQFDGLLQAGDGFGDVLLMLRVGEAEVAVRERELVVAPAGFLPGLDGVLRLVVVEQAAEEVRRVGIFRVRLPSPGGEWAPPRSATGKQKSGEVWRRRGETAGRLRRCALLPFAGRQRGGKSPVATIVAAGLRRPSPGHAGFQRPRTTGRRWRSRTCFRDRPRIPAHESVARNLAPRSHVHPVRHAAAAPEFAPRPRGHSAGQSPAFAGQALSLLALGRACAEWWP